MSILRPESVRVIAQGSRIDNLPDAAASAIAFDAERRLRMVIKEAHKFMQHSKRSRMQADDIHSSLRLLSVDGVFGFCTDAPLVFQPLGGGLFGVQDTEVELDDVASARLPPVPLQPSLALHWLVVEGVQPCIPENSARARTWDLLKTSDGGGGGGGSAEGRKRLRDGSTPGVLVRDGSVQLTKAVHHELSTEMQVYFTKVVEAIRACDATSMVVIRTLRNHAGLHQLVPYFTRFIQLEINENMRNLKVLTMLMRVTHALLSNKHLRAQLEHYSHQIMPSLLSCVVGKRLCGNRAVDDHWTLRHYAARLVAIMCKCYGELYPSLRGRIAKTLYDAFKDSSMPLTTRYGAIVGMVELGSHVFESVLWPLLPDFIRKLRAQVDVHAQFEAKLQKLCKKTGTASTRLTPKDRQKLTMKAEEAARCLLLTMTAASRFLKFGHSTPTQVHNLSTASLPQAAMLHAVAMGLGSDSAAVSNSASTIPKRETRAAMKRHRRRVIRLPVPRKRKTARAAAASSGAVASTPVARPPRSVVVGLETMEACGEALLPFVCSDVSQVQQAWL